MAEKLLINVAHEETRVALVESGRLSNFEIVTSRADNNKGNIYKGIVHRVNASLQAAFVDYGAEKQGFLPLGEIIPDLYPKGQVNKKLPIQDVLHQGQEVMVQVVKDEIGQKGAGLTTFISIAGRSLALEANSDKAGISRRLSDDDRKRLKKELNQLDVPDGHGIIMRTAAAEQDSGTIKDNKKYVEQLLGKAQERFRAQKGPGLVHQERSLPLRAIRDYVSSAVDEILIDDKETWEEVRNFCTLVAPEFVSRIKFYDDPRPLFSRFQIEDQIDDIFARRIDLPSGGSIVIDQTEALVAIDVNSGRVKTDDIEDTATKTNLEAAAEIARQLKIRDRGGLIVVDFIDMRERDNIRRVEDAVRDAFRADKAKLKFSKISEFGLMEISRQRLQGSVMRGSFTSCPACGGTGQIRSVESSALYLLRRLKETLLRGNHQHVEARMPVEIANYLLNRKRRELLDLERQTGTSIDVRAEAGCPPMQAYFELISRTTTVSRRPKRVLQQIDLVRSEVEKRELEDGEEVTIEVAVSEEAEVSVFAADRAKLDGENKALEAEMARAKEVEKAQKEADESLRREAELKAQKELLLAEAEKIRAVEDARWRRLSIWGRLKAWFGGGLPPLEMREEGEKRAEAGTGERAERGDRGERGDRDERRRRRDRDERDEHKRKKERGDKDDKERAEAPERSAEERGDKDRAVRPERGERPERRDRPERAERGDRGDRGRDRGPDRDKDKKDRPVESELMDGGGASASESDAKKKRRRRRRGGKGGDEGEFGGVSETQEAGSQPRTDRPPREGQPGREGQGREGREGQGREGRDGQGREGREGQGGRDGQRRDGRPPQQRPAPGATASSDAPAPFVPAQIVRLPVPVTPLEGVAAAPPVVAEAPAPAAPAPKLPKFGAIDLRGGTPRVITPKPASNEAAVKPTSSEAAVKPASSEAAVKPASSEAAVATESPASLKPTEAPVSPEPTAVPVSPEPVEAPARPASSEARPRASAPRAAARPPVVEEEVAAPPPPAPVSAIAAEAPVVAPAPPPRLPAPARPPAPPRVPAATPLAAAAPAPAPEVPAAAPAPEVSDEVEAGAEVEAEEIDGDGSDAAKRRRTRGRRGGRGRTKRDGEGAAGDVAGEAAADVPKE